MTKLERVRLGKTHKKMYHGTLVMYHGTLSRYIFLWEVTIEKISFQSTLENSNRVRLSQHK